MLEFAATSELRTLSLRIFDRSFAVTYYLQAVAIAIGLVGIAASLSAQVLARRKEFGLLAHLGLTRGRSCGSLPARARPGRCWVHWRAWHWALPCLWCWCTWSTRRASTGRWSCCCPGAALAGAVRRGAGRRAGHRRVQRARAAARSAAVLSVKEDW